MISKLKTLLAQCHLSYKDDFPQTLKDASSQYCIQRAKEEIELASIYSSETDLRLKRAIQLLNMARYKNVSVKIPTSYDDRENKTSKEYIGTEE